MIQRIISITALIVVCFQTGSPLSAKDVIDTHFDTAEEYRKKRMYDKAIEEYDLILTLLPKDLVQRTNELVAQYQRGYYDKKMTQLLHESNLIINYISILVAHRYRGDAYYLKSISSKQKGFIDVPLAKKALADYEAVLALIPKENRSKTMNGLLTETLAMKISVEMDIETKTPQYALVKKGREELKAKQYDKAIESFTGAIRQKPDYLEAYQGRAEAFELKDQHDRAIADCRKVIELDPKSEIALCQAGRIYYKKEDYKNALSCFNKALKLSPKYCEAMYLKGAVFAAQKDRGKAINEWEKVTGVCNYYSAAYDSLINAYNINEKYGKVIDTCTRYSKYYKSSFALYMRGLARIKSGGRHRAAVEDFTAALELSPSYGDALFMRGIAYAYQDQWDKAIQDFKNKRLDYRFTKLFNSVRDINAADANGASVLMWAVYDGKFELVKLLHKKGANAKKPGIIWIDKKKNHYYGGVLHVAAGHYGDFSGDMLPILKYLVETCGLGVNEGEIDSKTGGKTTFTPLLWACASGYFDRVEFLVKKGANIDIASQGLSPFTISLFADSNFEEKMPLFLLDRGAKVDYTNADILLAAAQKGFTDLIGRLVKKGMNVNMKDKNGWTALHIAARNGNLKTADFLISKGADVRSAAKETDAVGRVVRTWTPLQLAQKNGNIKVVALLKQKGA